MNKQINDFIADKLKPYLIPQDLTKNYIYKDYGYSLKDGYIPKIELYKNGMNIDYTILPPISNINLNPDVTKLHILQDYPLNLEISTNKNNIKQIFLNDNIPLISNGALNNFNHTLINFPKECEYIDSSSSLGNNLLKIYCYAQNYDLIKDKFNIDIIEVL